MRRVALLTLGTILASCTAISTSVADIVSTDDSRDSGFSSSLGSLVPEYALPTKKSLPLVKVGSRLAGADAWPVTPKLVAALRSVSRKLGSATQGSVSSAIYPTPLGFTTVGGLGLQEGQHLADAPCANECNRELYPNQGDFADCYQCGSANPFRNADFGSTEIVFTISYTRASLLLGGVQSTLSTACVSLLQGEGLKVKFLGSTFRLLPEAQAMAKFLPLDTISLRYVAWEMLVEIQGPDIMPFTLEKENLILGLWQLQQAGQDFRIKEAVVKAPNKVVLRFVTSHLPMSTSDKPLKVWQGKMTWLAQELGHNKLKDCSCRLLKAYEVYDETMADQFRILAGNPRRPDFPWSNASQWVLGLILVGAIARLVWQRMTGPSSIRFPEMTQYSSGVPGDRHHLKGVPLLMGDDVSLVNITISQKPDGSDWLLGQGSYGKVFKGLKNEVQQVAIKVLNHTDANELANFAKEIHLLRKLSFDRNIVQWYGACLQEENTMMVLEYMEGGDLMDAIALDRKNMLRWSRKGSLLALDIAKGLVHLHTHKVIHMDLKSKNILLDRDHTVAKITDVGLSRGMTSSNKSFTPGTLEYSAPEVLLGRFCDGKADIFSYGLVLWEIVTHEQPTRGGVRDCRVPQECPAEIDDLINRCMHTDPLERPTAKEVCDIIITWRVRKELELREARTGQKRSLSLEVQAQRNSAEI